MDDLVSRRRALARMIAAVGALSLPFALGASVAAAQGFDLTGDLPLPDTGPAPAAVSAPASAPPTVSQAGQDDQPSDEPAPEAGPAAPPGPWGIPPVKVTIPSLGVEAKVEAVGQDPDGAMSVPTVPDDVAWYKLGPGMGVPGNVVFAGHINWEGRTRTFGYLDQLDRGDVIQVIDEQGHGFEYAVESSHWVRAEGAPLEDIFAQPTEPVITLITCGGEYVPSRREYLDRLIVRAKGA